VDHAARALFVRAKTIHVETLDGRFDAGFEDRVEIDIRRRLRVALLAKGHRDEHERFRCHHVNYPNPSSIFRRRRDGAPRSRVTPRSQRMRALP
jgi:hypothetical protein